MTARKRLIIVGALALLQECSPLASGQEVGLVLSSSGTVRAGHRASATALLPALTPPCELRAAIGNRSIRLAEAVPRDPRIEWSWLVPAQARSAVWRLKLACGSRKASTSLRVIGRARAPALKLSTGRVRIRQYGTSTPSKEVAPTEEPSAEGGASEASTTPSPGNIIFSLEGGNCTDWADYKRPDIYNDRSPQDPDPTNWDAWTWPQHAQLEGLRVDQEPEDGAIAAWPISESSPVGHVAYVEAISGSGASKAVSVSEMNSPDATPQVIEIEGVSYPYETETDSLVSLEALGVVFIHER
jgi:surface antigen